MSVPVIDISSLHLEVIKSEGWIGFVKNLLLSSSSVDLRSLARFGLNESTVIFDNAEFRINSPRVVGISGENGSGKSTLLNILAHFVVPNSGKILIGGHPAGSIPGSVVLCRPSCEPFADFTPVQNVANACMFLGLDEAAIVPMAGSLLLSLGLNHEFLHKPSSTLSAGGKVKIGLASSMLAIVLAHNQGQRGQILLLDEPTNALDDRSCQLVYDVLLGLRKEFPDLTIVIATNRTSDLAACDEVWRVENQKLVMASSRSARIYDSDDVLQLQKGTVSRSWVNPFLRRNGNEVRLNPCQTILQVYSNLLPNLIPLFGGTQDWTEVAVALCGLYFTGLVRDAYRLIDRERLLFGGTYFAMLGSPMSRHAHFRKASFAGTTLQMLYALIVSFTLFMFYRGQLGIPDLYSVNMEWIGAFGLSLMGMIAFAYGLGLYFSLAPYVMRKSNYFYVHMSVPMLAMTFAGWYYPVENLPRPLNYLGQINPLTYFRLIIGSANSAPDWFLVMKLNLLSFLWFTGGYLTYVKGFSLVKRAKRLV